MKLNQRKGLRAAYLLALFAGPWASRWYLGTEWTKAVLFLFLQGVVFRGALMNIEQGIFPGGFVIMAIWQIWELYTIRRRVDKWNVEVQC